jgi:hypothetical protein
MSLLWRLSSLSLLFVLFSLGAADAAQNPPQPSTRRLTLADCTFRVVGQRLVQAIENGELRWEVDPGTSICVLTIEMTKPLGPLEIHASDLVLAYKRKGMGDRARCTAIRFLGTSRHAEEPEWALPPSIGGYLMIRDERLDQSTRVSIELGFGLEDEVTQIELTVTRPATPPLAITRTGASGNSTPAGGARRRRQDIPSEA